MFLFARSIIFLASILCLLQIECKNSKKQYDHIEDKHFWANNNKETLKRIKERKHFYGTAKNVILFIGDGMGITTLTAGRIFLGQQLNQTGESFRMTVEDFPHFGFSKTYNVDNQITDSAAGANALFTGVKTRGHVVGLDALSEYKHCERNKYDRSKLVSLAEMAQKSGKDAGFVTTARVTHATPSALYAHSNSRQWECDYELPKKYSLCLKDTGRQLFEDEPARNFKVIMGGGGKCLCIKQKPDIKCDRRDGLNLTDIWLKKNPDGVLVKNENDLMSVDTEKHSKLLGIFSDEHMPYQNSKSANVPSLTQMTTQAIKMLSKNPKGFFLMVEGGKIDLGHHSNRPQMSLHEFKDFDEAIATAKTMTSEKETMIVVTADHSHTLTINGYPKRGNDIFGLVTNPYPYETLTYANGPSCKDHRTSDLPNAINNTWKNIAEDPNRNDKEYTHLGGKYTSRETHGGEDVAVFANGPHSHLLRGTFEQNYIPIAISYAACYKGAALTHCNKSS